MIMKKENKDLNKGDCMNRKLILAAITVALCAGCAQATNITGATNNGNVYSVKPEHYSGIAGYRRYENFKLDNGHVLNLEFIREQAGKDNPTTFVNLIDTKAEINGILNTTREGKFYNGHAVFITPGGFVVGSSGVLNVGRLSVATPTSNTYNKLFVNDGKNYGDYAFDYSAAIGQKVSKLTQNSDASLPAGAAEIKIQGKVFANNGVEMTGSSVAVPGNIVNGVKHGTNEPPLTTADAANALFDSLVKTDGTLKDASKFEVNGSRILIKSTDSMDVSGLVTNGAVAANNANAKKGTFLTNEGANGMVVSGKVYDNSLARLYNKAGKLEVNNGAEVNGKQVIVQNLGTNLTVNSGAKLKASDKAQVVNNGSGNLVLMADSTVEAPKVQIINDGSGNLKASGTINADGELAFRNRGASLLIEGDVTNESGETAVRNYNGKATINGKLANNGNLGIINEGGDLELSSSSEITNAGKIKIASTEDSSGDMALNGKIDNTGEIRIYNDHGKMAFGVTSSIDNENGNLYIVSRKEGTGISQAAGSSLTNNHGNIVIRNSGTKTASNANGLELKGAVKATDGTIAINNDFGNMYVSTDVTVDGGNLGIINRGNGGTMTAGGKVTVTDGNVNVKNFGNGNMAVNTEFTHDGRVNVLANKGLLTLGSKVHNNSGVLSDNGGFYAASRVNGTGVKVTSQFVVDGSGEVLIKNISGDNGLDYAGTINTTGHQAALVNKKGDMEVSGSIKTTGAPIIISNQGRKLTVKDSANLNSGTQGTLVNTGSEKANFGNPTMKNMKTYEELNYKGPNGANL